jgi:hypothetical protein
MGADEMNTEDLTAFSIVNLGYALDDPTDQHRCLNFRVGFTDHEAAFSALVAIGDYNEFDGARVAQAIKSVGLDRYTRIMVGREGSPVIYVGPFFGDRDKTMLSTLTAKLQDVAADECDFDGRLLRAWWD